MVQPGRIIFTFLPVRPGEGIHALFPCLMPGAQRRTGKCNKITAIFLGTAPEASMRLLPSFRPQLSAIVVLAALCFFSSMVSAQNQPGPGQKAKSMPCSHDDSGLTLPDGFCATVFADGIGHARHMVVGPS